MRLAILLLVGLLEVVNCQWVQHNITTHVINTTSIQAPIYGWHSPAQNIGPARNLTQYANQQNGFVNSTRILNRPGQVLLFSQSYFKPGKFLQVREIIVRYPVQNFGVLSNRVITAIRLIEGQGNGIARILQGGIGWRNVTIRLQSQRGESLNYAVFIYGI